jgi:hypothetical protein
MAYHPDEAFMDVKTELVSDDGRIKYAAHYLYGYYCLRRNKETGLCFPSLKRTVQDTGLPKSNVSMLKAFLEEIAWIEVYETGVIRPLKGFYPPEEIFNFRIRKLLLRRETVLIIRTEVLTDRTLVLIIRTLFKGSLNQLLEPASLTSFSADSLSANSATTPTDQKNRNLPPPDKNGLGKPIVSNIPPAGKPTPRKASAGKPADERFKHPSIQMVKEITGRYPPKDQWNKIIREIINPDIEFFRSSYEIWGSFDGNRTNLDGWLYQPNKKKMLPQSFQRGFEGVDLPNGSSPPGEPPEIDFEDIEPESLTVEKRSAALVILRGMLRTSNLDALQNLKINYTEDDWQWLMSELSKKSATV